MIAGEMLNKETSTQYYDLGKLVDVPIKGYPQLIVGNVINTFRISCGHVFIPPGMNKDEFEARLMNTILSMEAELPIQPLSGAHSKDTNWHTNIKIKSSMKQTKRKEKFASHNIKRKFGKQIGYYEQARFFWSIVNISDIDYEITSNNVSSSISQFVGGILYDADDVTIHGHNEVTFNFSRESLKGFKNIVDVSVVIGDFGNPLMVELSENWKNRIGDMFRNPIRNIDESNLYHTDFTKLTFRPVDMANGVETSTEVCAKCRSVLWGDFYAFRRPKKLPGCNLYVAMCPLCVHTSPSNNAIENEYYEVYRTTHPRDANLMIEYADESDIKKDLYREVLKAYVDTDEGYMLIGDKYASFTKTDDYLYTPLVNDPTLQGRLICESKLFHV
jgi:hypothetical protein